MNNDYNGKKMRSKYRVRCALTVSASSDCDSLARVGPGRKSVPRTLKHAPRWHCYR